MISAKNEHLKSKAYTKDVYPNPEIYYPLHLVDENSLSFPYKFLATSKIMLLAAKVAFDFTVEECEIYNELCNTDTVWLNEKAYTAVGKLFSIGDRMGVMCEPIYMMISYLFDGADKYYNEDWEYPEHIKKLINDYLLRIKEKYPSPKEWLDSIFSIDNANKVDERTSEMLECYPKLKLGW